MKKKVAIAATVLTIGLGGLGTVGLANAQTESSTGTGIVDKLVSRFGLNRDEVIEVFDEQRAEREAEHLSNVEEKLAKEVSNGDLTQEQSDKLLSKFKELQATRAEKFEEFKNLDSDNRKVVIEEERAELEAWMEANNIPEKYARFLRIGKLEGPGSFRGEMLRESSGSGSGSESDSSSSN